MEAEERKNATRVSALHMILESLKKTIIFLCDVAIAPFPEEHQRFVQDYLSLIHHLFLNKLNLMEDDNGGVSEILIIVLEILHDLNYHLKFDELVKMNSLDARWLLNILLNLLLVYSWSPIHSETPSLHSRSLRLRESLKSSRSTQQCLLAKPKDVRNGPMLIILSLYFLLFSLLF